MVGDDDDDEQPSTSRKSKSPDTKSKETLKAESSDVEICDDDDDDNKADVSPKDGTKAVNGEQKRGETAKAPSSPKMPRTPQNTPLTPSKETAKRHQWTYEESINIWKGVQVSGLERQNCHRVWYASPRLSALFSHVKLCHVWLTYWIKHLRNIELKVIVSNHFE